MLEVAFEFIDQYVFDLRFLLVIGLKLLPKLKISCIFLERLLDEPALLNKQFLLAQ